MPEADEIKEELERAVLPAYMKPRLLAYILDGTPVGHFLTAVLSNDLKEAVGQADDNNVVCLPQYVRYLYNYAPSPCWGSPANVDKWIEQGGLNKTRRVDAGEEGKPQREDSQVAV